MLKTVMGKSLLVILLCVSFAFGAAAANGPADTPHPLAPPDTSSPGRRSGALWHRE